MVSVARQGLTSAITALLSVREPAMCSGERSHYHCLVASSVLYVVMRHFTASARQCVGLTLLPCLQPFSFTRQTAQQQAASWDRKPINLSLAFKSALFRVLPSDGDDYGEPQQCSSKAHGKGCFRNWWICSKCSAEAFALGRESSDYTQAPPLP